MGLNWKLMWACFFGGAALFCLVGAVFGNGTAITLMFTFVVFSALLVGWDLSTKNQEVTRYR